MAHTPWTPRRQASGRAPASRRLNTPQMHYVPKMSLPRLLAEYVMPKSKQVTDTAVVPKPPDQPKPDKRPRQPPDAARFEGTSGNTPMSGENTPSGSNNTCSSPSSPRAKRESPRRKERVVKGGALSAVKHAFQMEALSEQPALSPVTAFTGAFAGNSSKGLALESPADPPPRLSARVTVEVETHQPPTLLGHMRPHKLGDLAAFAEQGEEEMHLSEYARRRKVHPRLRWPRLASRGSDGSGPLDIPEELPVDGPPVQPTLITAIDCDPDERVEAFDGKSLLSSSASTFYLGGSKKHGQSSSTGIDSTSRTRTSPGLTPRPAILPRARAREQPTPGSFSTLYGTVNADENGASVVSSFASLQIASTGSITSTTSKVDRKWLIRTAPISCLPSQPTSRAARRLLPADPEDQSTVAKNCGESGEYLNFQRWGISDDYINSLVEAMCHDEGKSLKGIRHMNLSDNRLTEHAIEKLMVNRLPEKLLSLNLASNNLTERSAIAALQLIGRCHALKELDLSGNALGDAIVEELCNKIEQCPVLEGLGLANCSVGVNPKGGIALGFMLSASRELRSLDLHWNSLHGVGAGAFLRGLYDNGLEGAGKLRRLDLAFNRLGSGQHTDEAIQKESDRNAKILASVFHDGQTLFHLDISHNGFDADECNTLANGLLHNHTLFGIHLVGNDATIDDLGFVVPTTKQQSRGKPQSPDVGGEVVENTTITRSTTAHKGVRAFDDDADVPPIMAAESHHRLMNNCAVNVPAELKIEHPARSLKGDMHSNKLRLNPSLQSLASEASPPMFSTEDLRVERNWATDQSRVNTTADFVTKESTLVQRNVNSCWICENWIEHKVVYTPGVSGSEQSADEVESAYALFSIDGFSRPTRLRVHEETHRRSVANLHRRRKSMATSFMAHGEASHRKSVVLSGLHPGLADASTARSSKVEFYQSLGSMGQSMRSSRCSTQGQPALTSNGKVLKWVGARMLPPTMEPLEVIFVINGQIKVAMDMKQTTLASPKLVTLSPDYQPDLDTPRVEEIKQVNTLQVGYDAFEQLRRGRMAAVCVLEDPSNRNELTVVPRQLVAAAEKRIQLSQWRYETSVFKDYPRLPWDAAQQAALIDACFESDWNHTRLPQILKNDATRSQISSILRPRYLSVMLLYMSWAFTGFEQTNRAVGLSFSVFRDNTIRDGGRGPGKLIDNQACKLNDVDCMFVAANVIDRGKRSNFKVLPEKGLARFQFLEALVRLAFRRFLGNKTPNASTAEECSGSVLSLLGHLVVLEDEIALRRSFNEAFFTEECCMVIREHMETLRAVFDGYKVLFVYPGRSAKNITFGAWLQLLDDSGIVCEDFPPSRRGTAFALAKDIRADVTTDWRHMELNWSEFIVALGAVVRLQSTWDKEFVADLLDEFITDYIDEAYSKLLERRNGSSKASIAAPKSSLYDPSMGPLVAFITRIFEDTDDDGSGTLDMREFRRAVTAPHVKEELASLGIQITDINVIFMTADADGSGSVSLRELIDCFVRLKTATKGLERAISYIRKAFIEADLDGSGTLNIVEFHMLFEQPAVLKKLSSLGVTPDDVSELFEAVDKQGTGDVTIEQVIEGFVFLRDPQNAIVRGVKLLKKLFEEADSDGSDSLSLEEVMETFADAEVDEKLESLKLQVPNWEVLFDELDLDKNGELSWEEVSDGMTMYWARHHNS